MEPPMPTMQSIPKDCTKAALRSRGWTEKLITTFLGDNYRECENPHYKNAAPMRLYPAKMVIRVEKTLKFKAALELAKQRQSGAKKAIETKRSKILKDVQDFAIGAIPDYSQEELIRRACENYNNIQSTFDKWASPSGQPEFLARICVNYLRHACTDYDDKLGELEGRVGTGEACHELKVRILEAIGDAYPWLYLECCKQESRSLDQLYSDW